MVAPNQPLNVCYYVNMRTIRAAFLAAFVTTWLAGCAAQVVPDLPLMPGAPPIGAVLYLTDWSAYRCSAVAISSTQAVTARHCNAMPGHTLLTPEGEDHLVDRVQDHPMADVSLLTLPAGDGFPEWAGVANSPPLMFTPVLFVGYGCDAKFGVRPGQFIRTQSGYDRYTGKVCPGDSGGAVFDVEGNLSAIMTNSFWPSKEEAAGVPARLYRDIP